MISSKTSIEVDHDMIDLKDAAILTNTPLRTIRRYATNGSIEVVKVHGRGGKSGSIYQVPISSLPDDGLSYL